MQDSHRKIALSIVGVFTAVQLIILFTAGYTPYPDSNGYLLLAEEALQQGDLYPIAKNMHELAFLWNIGAINTARLSLSIFSSITPLLIVYSFMKGLTAWIFYLVARRLTTSTLALTALILYMIYPANYGESTSLLSELPFIFFTMLSLYLLLCRRMLLAGIAIAVANWYRPMASVFLLSFVIFIISRHFLVKRSKPIIQSALLIGGFAVTILMIGTAERLRTGRFYYQAATGWMALMQYSWDNDTDTLSDKHLFSGGNPNIITAKTDVIAKDSIWQRNFLLWLKHNKQEYVRQMPTKLIKTYVSDNTTFCTFLPNKNQRQYMYGELSMEQLLHDCPHFSAVQWLTVANLIYYYTLLCLSGYYFFFILIKLFLRKTTDKQGLPTTILCTSVIAIGTAVLLFFGHGESRFHQPFMPFILMLSASALCTFRHTKV